MKRVLLDVDGVLAGFASAYLDVIREVTGRTYGLNEITAFDIGASLGLTKDEASACKRWLGASRGWCEAIPVLDGAQAGVAALQSIADVYIVTSPWNSCATWTHEREAWLKRHFDIPHSRVVHTSAKWLCRGDLIVDDKASAVEQWQAEHPTGRGVLWSTPHNQLEGWAGERTNDWGVLHEIVAGTK